MFAVLGVSGIAKRVAPKPVPPVIADGVSYSAEGDGKDSFITATDQQSGRVLWRTKIFHNRIYRWKEEDNQWLFISDLMLNGGNLLARDEKNRCYLVDIKTHHVRKRSCGNFFPFQEPR